MIEVSRTITWNLKTVESMNIMIHCKFRFYFDSVKLLIFVDIGGFISQHPIFISFWQVSFGCISLSILAKIGKFTSTIFLKIGKASFWQPSPPPPLSNIKFQNWTPPPHFLPDYFLPFLLSPPLPKSPFNICT